MVEPRNSRADLPEDGPLPGEGPLPPEPQRLEERAFGDPTDSERIRAEDRFVFDLPRLPTDLSWPRVRAALLGADAGTRWQRGAIAVAVLLLLGIWGWRERYVRWPLDRLQGHTKPVLAVATTARRSLLASGGDDHALRLWTLDRAELVKTVEVDRAAAGDGVLGLAFSPKGDLVLAATGTGAQLWGAESGQLVRALDPWDRGALAVAFSPRGDTVAASRRGDSAIRVFSAETGALVHTLRGHTGDVFALAYAPTGDQLISGSADGTARVWSLATFHEVRAFGNGSNVLAVAWSPAGDLLATASDDHVLRFWGAFDGRPAGEAVETHGSVRSLAFSSAGDRIFFGGDDEIVRAVAPSTGDTVFSRPQGAKPLAVALSPDGERLAVGLASGEVLVWWVPPASK